MIHFVNTKEQEKKCLQYLLSKHIHPIAGTVLFYAEDEAGIYACAGWNFDTGGTIDPFVTDKPSYAEVLYNYMKGIMVGKGYRHIQVFTNNEKVIARLINTEGFRVWTSSIKGLIKDI